MNVWRGVPSVVLILVFAIGCGGNAAGGPDAPEAGAAAEAWALHRGDGGLVLLHPRGWSVQERGGGAFAVFHPGPSGAADAVVAVQPIERIDGSALGVVREVGRVLPDLFPGARASQAEVRSESPEVAIADFSYEAGGESFAGAALCFRSGDRGVLYAYATGVGAPEEASSSVRHILENFSYVLPGQGGFGAGQVPEMVSWRDPKEDAFTCPVPKGWSVDGGLARFHAVDVRPEVLVTSPDGRILVRLGDSWIPPFVTPGPALTSTGFGEGMWYSPDGLLRVLVQRYLGGAEFATAIYLPQRVGRFEVTDRQERPELAARAAAMWQQAGMNVRVDTGEVSFTAETDAGRRRGYAMVQTVFLPMMGSAGDGNWFVTGFHGYLATADREDVARAVMASMVGGFRMNPRWVDGMVQTAGEVSRITYETQGQINDMIHQTYVNRQASEERTAQRRAQSNRGLTVIEDPVTGEEFEVPLGSNYWWRLDQDGPILGTEGALEPQAPGYWVREMIEHRE